MSDDVPSPAGQRRPAEPSRDGLTGMPWESALYDAVRALERRVNAAEAERDKLVLEVHMLNQKVWDARRRLENWQLRQQAWHRERDELLRRLS